MKTDLVPLVLSLGHLAVFLTQDLEVEVRLHRRRHAVKRNGDVLRTVLRLCGLLAFFSEVVLLDQVLVRQKAWSVSF